MNQAALLLFFVLLAYGPGDSVRVSQQQAPAITIQAPVSGEALQGTVPIQGSSAVDGFASAELSFAYRNDPSGTWFMIADLDQPVSNGVLTQWDTNAITDGVYDLRLVVTLKDGSQQTAIVSGVRVRNYTPVETVTPTAVTPTATPVPGDTPVPTLTPTPTITPIPPTATALPPNPAQLSTQDIMSSFGKGALGIAALFALAGIFRSLHSAIHKD